jgi:hypothetical protein
MAPASRTESESHEGYWPQAAEREAPERPRRRTRDARPQMKYTAAAVRSSGGLCLPPAAPLELFPVVVQQQPLT